MVLLKIWHPERDRQPGISRKKFLNFKNRATNKENMPFDYGTYGYELIYSKGQTLSIRLRISRKTRGLFDAFALHKHIF